MSTLEPPITNDDEAVPPIEPMPEVEDETNLANEEAAPQASDVAGVDEDDDSDGENLGNKQQDESHGCCYKCCSVLCCACPCCLTLPQKWPRTFGILMGIVVPLFSLIGVSLLFGFGLATLEAPGEVATNNDIIATTGAVALQEELLATITEELPTICSSVFWLEQAVELPFQECLADNQTNALSDGVVGADGNSTNSTNGTTPIINCTEPPSLEGALIEDTIQQVFVGSLAQCSFQQNNTISDRNRTDLNVSLPTDLTIEYSDLITHMTECGQEALQIIGEYQFEDIIDSGLLSSSVSFDWIRCTAPDPDADDENIGDAIGGAIGDILNPFTNTTQYLPSVQEEAVMTAWKQSQEELYCQYLEEAIEAGGGKNMTFDEFAAARLDALERSFIDADGFSICEVNYFAGAWFWWVALAQFYRGSLCFSKLYLVFIPCTGSTHPYLSPFPSIPTRNASQIHLRFTVMTTVGYGNTAPTTEGGRAIIFTLGFFSILLFAGILLMPDLSLPPSLTMVLIEQISPTSIDPGLPLCFGARCTTFGWC